MVLIIVEHIIFLKYSHTSLQSQYSTGFYCKVAVSHKGMCRSRRTEACSCGGGGWTGTEGFRKLTVTQMNFEMSIAHQSSEFHPCIKNSSNNQLVTLHLRMKVMTLFNN